MTTFERPLNGSSGATQSEDDDGEVPYVSLPIEASQPACLAAIARLHGLTPAAPDKASVLELGCGSGGNIIPLAARFPGAKFAGIDLMAALKKSVGSGAYAKPAAKKTPAKRRA